MRVMLIDDSNTMRKIQKRALSGIGGIDEVVEACNGREGLETLQKEGYNFDFVLLDVNMPEMSGLEVLTAVRADANSNGIPIIMCTSVADKAQVMEAIKAGASNYVVKPFKPEELQKKVEAVLKK